MGWDGAEVIVAGAGPAGAATALMLARAGRDVLLLDRMRFPRPKPCGDCLSSGATALLDRMGVLDRVISAPHAVLAGWRIVAPAGAAFHVGFRHHGTPAGADHTWDARSGDCALSIERSVFDATLLDAARDAGVRFEQQAVTGIVRNRRGRVHGVHTRDRIYNAAITVGADGLRSIIATRLGARAPVGSIRKLSLTYHLPVDRVDDCGEMHVGAGICAGLAPVDDGRCNLTVVADAHRFGRTVAMDPRAFVRDALDTLPRLRGRISDAALSAAVPLASGPFDRPVHRVAFDGAVLVGDAAGYFDPFTGQGVYQALASAELLAPCIEAALLRGDVSASAFSGYVRARTALVRGSRVVQHGIEAVLSRPALADRAIARIRRAPAFAHALLAVTGDIEPARALLSPAALSSLLFPVQPENAA